MFADHLNFTAAAGALHLSQPSLHAKVRKLQVGLGVELYERDGRGLRLTAAGERLAAFARDAVCRADDLLAELHTGPDRLDRIVSGVDKQRFESRNGRIRAAQGHSIQVDLDLIPVTPPDRLYHGTTDRFLHHILTEGLQPMGRNHVHLSPDVATARSVGARRGRPVVLTVDTDSMHAAGHTFHRSANGIWLTAHVPPTYLTPFTQLDGEAPHPRPA